MSKPAPKMTFSILWNPIELPVKEAPSVGEATVQRLDEEVLVLQTNTQANLTISLYMMGILLGLCMLTALFFFNKIEGKIAFFQIFFDVSEGSFNSGSNEFLFVGVFLLLLYLFLCGVAFWLLDISLLQPRPCPVVLNRRTKKAYGSHRGKLVELDWKKITPIITEAVNISSGVQRMCQLVFAELDPPKNPAKRTRKGKGFIVYFHPAWGWAECRGLWEFIRVYMEESPKKLPTVLVTPPVATVDNLLNEGPYAESNRPAATWEYIKEHGHAKMGFGQAFELFLYAPFVLFNALQLFARRQVKLPETALPPVQENKPNPYSITAMNESERALWQKASRRVALQLLVLMVLGMGMYSYLGYSVVHWHNESERKARIEYEEKLKASEARRKEQEAQEQERKRLWEEKINSKEYKQEQEERRKAQYIRNCIIYSYSGKGREFCEQAYEREKKANALEEAHAPRVSEGVQP